MENTNFPEIYRNRVLDHRLLRFYAVYMTALSDGGLNIALAKAIEQFVINDEQHKHYEPDLAKDVITDKI